MTYARKRGIFSEFIGNNPNLSEISGGGALQGAHPPKQQNLWGTEQKVHL